MCNLQRTESNSYIEEYSGLFMLSTRVPVPLTAKVSQVSLFKLPCYNDFVAKGLTIMHPVLSASHTTSLRVCICRCTAWSVFLITAFHVQILCFTTKHRDSLHLHLHGLELEPKYFHSIHMLVPLYLTQYTHFRWKRWMER